MVDARRRALPNMRSKNTHDERPIDDHDEKSSDEDGDELMDENEEGMMLRNDHDSEAALTKLQWNKDASFYLRKFQDATSRSNQFACKAKMTSINEAISNMNLPFHKVRRCKQCYWYTTWKLEWSRRRIDSDSNHNFYSSDASEYVPSAFQWDVSIERLRDISKCEKVQTLNARLDIQNLIIFFISAFECF